MHGHSNQFKSKMLGDAVLNAPCTSIGMLEEFPGTVRTFLTALCISKGITLLIPMNLCVIIGEKLRGFEKAFLVNCVCLIIPATAYRFGAHNLKSVTTIDYLADGNILLSQNSGILICCFWIVVSIAVLLEAKRDWISTKH